MKICGDGGDWGGLERGAGEKIILSVNSNLMRTQVAMPISNL